MKHLNENKILRLKKIIELLSEFEYDIAAIKCKVISESDYDESVIIGTESSYLLVVKKIIEFLYLSNLNASEGIEYDKENTYAFTNEIKSVFDEFSDVWPVCAYLTKNETDTKKLVDKFKNS